MPYHHLILIRESRGWSLEVPPPEPDDDLAAVYRAVRLAFGDRVEVTVLDPRSGVVLLPLLLRDAWRFRVPPATLWRTVASAGVSSAIFDGQLLFQGEIPDPRAAVTLIRGRMRVHRVGVPDPEDQP
jgi:hypothetical protein